MAIEQGLNVHVVLLPDNHDPDSYVQEVGASGFAKYIQENKKDIILFKLEASLKEAKDDSVKKSELINEIAETLSKINKLEEFTKQQDYIRRCAQLLHIDEAGLVSLVNKKIREKIVKKDAFSKTESEELERQAAPEITEQQSDITSLLRKDYAQEKGLIRILLEYGNKPFDDQISIADYIRLKVGDTDFVNKSWQKIYSIYYHVLESSLQFPTEKTFTYHDEEDVRNLAIEALYFPYELSEGWATEHQIFTPTKEMIYIDDVKHTVIYFSLRKIKSTYQEFWEGLQGITDLTEEKVVLASLIELKKHEQKLLLDLKIVAVK